MKKFRMDLTEEQRAELMRLTGSMTAHAGLTQQYLTNYVSTDDRGKSLEELNRQYEMWRQLSNAALMARVVE